MQIDRRRRNGNYEFCLDRLGDRATGAGVRKLTMSSQSSSTPFGAANYIEHHISKLDTLAGVAIKYGVEVADIKRMNGLATDLQMFALKTLQIPLPGRHPPSPDFSNGYSTSGQSSFEQTPPRRTHADVLESLQSLRLKSPQWKVSSAMSSLQGYYGLKPPNHKGVMEGTEMAVYRTGRAHYLEDEPFPRPSPFSYPPPGHRKSRSVNGFFTKNGELADNVIVTEAGDRETEKSNEKSVRRRSKAETEYRSCTPIMLLEDNSGGSGFSARTGKGLALRPKSASRIAVATDSDSGWLNPIPVGSGDSLIADRFCAVRKCSSTSSLQDQDNTSSSSIRPSSKRSLKADLQALSTAAISRPIFDGMPKPVTARRNKNCSRLTRFFSKNSFHFFHFDSYGMKFPSQPFH